MSKGSIGSIGAGRWPAPPVLFLTKPSSWELDLGMPGDLKRSKFLPLLPSGLGMVSGRREELR